MCKDYSFEQKIIELIKSGIEGEYWDFKYKYYGKTEEDKTHLLHDIICMANTQSDHDGYIIFGIDNNTHDAVGVENDPNRLVTENIISFLRGIPFSAGVRPSVQINTIHYQSHEIDVLIVKNTRNTPYFLSKNYNKVLPGCIYTRVGDSNTPINQSADMLHVEHLWKKRLGLLSSPLFRFRDMLLDREGWMATDTDYDTYYYITAPEFTLKYSKSTDYHVQGNYFFADYWPFHEPVFQDMYLYYFGTALTKVPIVLVDDGKYVFPVPNATVITFPDTSHNVRYYYYSEETITFASLVYFEDNTYPDRQPLYDMIPIFHSEKERHAFEDYIKKHDFNYYADIIKEWNDHFHANKSYCDWLTIDEGCAKFMNDEWKWNTLLVNNLIGFRLRSEFSKHE